MSSVIKPRISHVTIEIDVIDRSIKNDLDWSKPMFNSHVYAGVLMLENKSLNFLRYYTITREQREDLCSYYGLARTSHLANQSMVVYEIYYESK